MLLEVGRIARAHGVRGEVMVDLLTDVEERLHPGSTLDTDRGPLEVRSANHHQKQRWIVRFVGIDGREAAEALHGLALRAEAIDDPDALWVHELVGTAVVEARGATNRGTVVAVVDNPAHALLELDSGALVPIVFVLSCADGVTTIDPPDGLFDVI